MKYRLKQIDVEAVKYLGDGSVEGVVPQWVWSAFKTKMLSSKDGQDPLLLKLFMGGQEIVKRGDWLIMGDDGQIASLDDHTFNLLYEKIDE